MTLEQALAYLETTARVSCPQITCEQAGEIAGLLRDLSDQHQVDIAEMVSWKIHAQVLHERDEALAKLRKAEREWDEARDGRDEAEDQVNTSLSRADQWHREFIRLTQQSGEFIRLTQQSERTEQTACGFAWDCGREMARLEECLQQCGLQAFMRNRSPEEVAGHMKYIADSWGLERKRLIDALCKRGECRHFVCPGKGIEVGEDFDADDYAKTGRK